MQGASRIGREYSNRRLLPMSVCHVSAGYVVKSNDQLVNNLGVNLPGRMASTSPIIY